MDFSIRTAERKDYPAILSLIKELAAFENAEHKVINSVEKMEAEDHLFECFVAEKPDGEIIGMALYYFTYYTWVGKSLYLDDLYVKEVYRGNNIGQQLLQKLFDVAKETKCNRIRWQVLNWNEPAIKFYEKLGVTIDKEWYNCDVLSENI